MDIFIVLAVIALYTKISACVFGVVYNSVQKFTIITIIKPVVFYYNNILLFLLSKSSHSSTVESLEVTTRCLYYTTRAKETYT